MRWTSTWTTPATTDSVNVLLTATAWADGDTVQTTLDVVVVDVQCDYLKADLGNMKTGDTEMGSSFLENSGGIGGIMFFGSSRPGGQGNRDIWYSSDGSSLECRTWAEIKSAF